MTHAQYEYSFSFVIFNGKLFSSVNGLTELERAPEFTSVARDTCHISKNAPDDGCIGLSLHRAKDRYMLLDGVVPTKHLRKGKRVSHEHTQKLVSTVHVATVAQVTLARAQHSPMDANEGPPVRAWYH